MLSAYDRLDLHVPVAHSVLYERWVDRIPLSAPPECLASHGIIKQMKLLHDESTAMFLLPMGEDILVCKYAPSPTWRLLLIVTRNAVHS